MNVLINYDYKYPIRLLYGIIKGKHEDFAIPMLFPAQLHWGECVKINGYEINELGLLAIELSWISLQSRRSFFYYNILDLENRILTADAITLIIGLSPIGEIAIWLYHELQSVLLKFDKAIDITILVTDKMIENTQIPIKNTEYAKTISQLCSSDIREMEIAIPGLRISNYIPEGKWKNFMRNYNYRYIIENINNGLICYSQNAIYDSLFDGTHNKLNDGRLMKYHQAGKPKKLHVDWHIGKSEYSAYFWFEDERIREVFDRFYGAHPDTKTDFIIRIDAEKRKYELALYRYGLKEPQVIPDDVYQLLVFKNKFEDYRSENYNQERGAWIW